MKTNLGYNFFLSHSFTLVAEQQEQKSDDDQPALFEIGVIFLTLAYISLTAGIIHAFSRVKKFQYIDDINRGSSSKKTGDRILLWHFIFLSMCLCCRLLNSGILLYNMAGFSGSNNIQSKLLTLFYYHSMIFLWVSFSLLILQYRFINLRLTLYANLTEVKQFQAQFRFSRLVFLLTLLIILTVNLSLSYVECFSQD